MAASANSFPVESKTEREELLNIAKQCMDDAKEKIPYGSSNLEHKGKNEADKRIRFIDVLNKEFLKPMLIDPKNPSPNEKLLILIVNSLFATAVGAGNCGEMSDIVYAKLLNTNIPREILLFTTKSGVTNHCFVLLNRESDVSVENISEWPDSVIMVDPWARLLEEGDRLRLLSKVCLVDISKFDVNEFKKTEDLDNLQSS